MISGDFSAAWNMGSPARGPAGGQNAADGLGLSRLRPLRLAALLMLAMAPGLARAAPPKEVVPLPSSPELGKAEGHCRANEAGPALMVSAVGLKDRVGRLKLEVYPSNDADWLQDDNILLYHGKTFRRVEEEVPQTGTPVLCIRVPGPGPYSVMLLHDRDSNHKFNFRIDGVGFASNPRMGWGKPRAAAARMVAGQGITRINIVLNYFHGLGMSPIHNDD